YASVSSLLLRKCKEKTAAIAWDAHASTPRVRGVGRFLATGVHFSHTKEYRSIMSIETWIALATPWLLASLTVLGTLKAGQSLGLSLPKQRRNIIWVTIGLMTWFLT